MSDELLICSDIHGCWFTLVRLLNAAPRGVRLLFGGDLIDRGPHSRQVVEFAMENQIPTTMGNHCSLALDFYGRNARCANYYEREVWLYNGGECTLGNWPTHSTSSGGGPRPYRSGNRVPDSVLDWMEALPAYLYPSDVLDSNGRRLLLSHTGYGLEADKDTQSGWFQALWGRHEFGDGEFPDDGLFRTYGHSLVKEALVTNAYANIDSGAAYGKRGYGVLSALLWPSKAILTQPFDETPVEPTFTIVNGQLVG